MALVYNRLWVSCPKFTTLSEVDPDYVITWSAPFTRRFVRQPVANLVRWAEKFGPTVISGWRTEPVNGHSANAVRPEPVTSAEESANTT
jgi:hypothetical protein